jgi:pimeloyl-ACP methyl ester carboxylesterase
MTVTIVLVHGAYAESSSWNGVLPQLTQAGHRVLAFATPLRSVSSDAALLSALVRSLDGPVVLAGHSYGGAVITNVDPGGTPVVGLVYVAGFALDPGESCGDASALVPGSTLADTLTPVPTADGGVDTYIAPEKYHHQFAADLPADEAALMAVTQRPVTQAGLFEPSGPNPLWRTVPSWFVYGELDHNIPAGAHAIMAERAHARSVTMIPGASHVVGISHPAETVAVILEAAGQPALADA